MRTIAAFCLAITLLPSLASTSNADCGYLWGGPGLYGGGVVVGPQPYIPAPPYFALHPPVYYGKRYTRPYGASPFASRSVLNSNPAYAPELAPTIRQYPVHQVVNPYHPSAVPANTVPANAAPALASPARKSAGPRIIQNPYVEQSSVQYTVH
jgi:hypothetical protein